jgi:hypothetical protein
LAGVSSATRGIGLGLDSVGDRLEARELGLHGVHRGVNFGVEPINRVVEFVPQLLAEPIDRFLDFMLQLYSHARTAAVETEQKSELHIVESSHIKMP